MNTFVYEFQAFSPATVCQLACTASQLPLRFLAVAVPIMQMSMIFKHKNLILSFVKVLSSIIMSHCACMQKGNIQKNNIPPPHKSDTDTKEKKMAAELHKSHERTNYGQSVTLVSMTCFILWRGGERGVIGPDHIVATYRSGHLVRLSATIDI